MKDQYILRIKLSKEFWKSLDCDEDNLNDIKKYIIFLEESCERQNIYTDLKIDFQDGFDIKTFIEESYEECKKIKECLYYQDQNAFDSMKIERVY